MFNHKINDETTGTQTAPPQQPSNNPYSMPPYPHIPPNAGGIMMQMHPSSFPMQYPMMWPQMMFPGHHPALMQQQPIPHHSSQHPDIVKLDREESEEIMIRRRHEARDVHLLKIAELEEAEAKTREREQVMLQERARVARERRVQQVVAALVMYITFVNEISKYKNPEQYILDMVILECVQEEVAPELLVELVDADGMYLCCSQSAKFRSLRASYHIQRETVDEEILSCVKEFLEEFTKQVSETRDKSDENNPFQLVSNDLMDETIKEVGRETLQEYISERRSQELLTSIIDELILDTYICEDAYDEVVQEDLMTSILDSIISECIHGICSEIKKDPTTLANISSSSHHHSKSAYIDFILERTLDRTIMAMMMELIATNGASFAANDVIESIMDKQIIEVMLSEMHSLGELKENITFEVPASDTPRSSIVSPSTGTTA